MLQDPAKHPRAGTARWRNDNVAKTAYRIQPLARHSSKFVSELQPLHAVRVRGSGARGPSLVTLRQDARTCPTEAALTEPKKDGIPSGQERVSTA